MNHCGNGLGSSLLRSALAKRGLLFELCFTWGIGAHYAAILADFLSFSNGVFFLACFVGAPVISPQIACTWERYWPEGTVADRIDRRVHRLVFGEPTGTTTFIRMVVRKVSDHVQQEAIQ
uniref:Uncharacterized protein n=1 Tax=Ditylenchus dipsaci TaxID=166011 RepID=A0A915CRL5_9BILA